MLRQQMLHGNEMMLKKCSLNWEYSARSRSMPRSLCHSVISSHSSTDKWPKITSLLRHMTVCAGMLPCNIYPGLPCLSREKMCRLGVKKLYKYEYISIFPKNRHAQNYLSKRRSFTTVNDYNNYAKHRNVLGCLDQYQTNIEYTEGEWPMSHQALKNETNFHLKELEWVKGWSLYLLWWLYIHFGEQTGHNEILFFKLNLTLKK